MECHKCQHGKDVAAGKYRGVPFAETPCARCELKENASFAIEFDPERDAGDLSVDPGNMGGVDVVAALAPLLVGLLRLPSELRDVICWRYMGMMYRDIALVQGVTVAAVEARHRRAMAMWPELRRLFPEKVAKQARRRKGKREEKG
jgi:DNA-directed RNA polymerase specialized sigma24 family protein